MKKASNKNLKQAKKNQKDEFYTQLPDIERELKHYQNHFKNKVVYCNCDDPRVSNFFHYFSYKFESLKLKKLITTCYKNQDVDLFSSNNSERAIYLEYEGDRNKNRIPDREEIEVRHLQGDGDFRSEECIELLKQSDIVVTNPPFEFEQWIVEYALKGHKTKKTGDGGYDGGYDGHISLRFENEGLKVCLVEVKGGSCDIKNIWEFENVIDRQKADIGIFVCFGKKLTKGMKKQSDETKKVRIAGLFEIKKLSILTVEGIIEQNYPDWLGTIIQNSTYF